jgi:acyl dehydratase
MSYTSLFWEDVEEGAALPGFSYEMSQLRLVAFVRATGLYDYIHFDRDYARSVGAKDAFASNSHISGLMGRLITDWAGPSAEIRSFGFMMRGQCCAGDVLAVSGKVGRKFRDGHGHCLVEIADLNIATQDQPSAAMATAVVALPSRQHGPVTTRKEIPELRSDVTAGEVPAFAQHLVGKTKEITYRAQPVAESELHLYCEAVEDWNPLYWDKVHAVGTRHKGLVCPPLAQLYGAGSSGPIGVGYGKPGQTVPTGVQKGLTGIALLQDLRQVLIATQAPIALPGFPEVVISNSQIECYRPVRVGDELRAEQFMTGCGPLKRTRLGEGHFFSWVNIEKNQLDELVRTVSYTMFMYRTLAE